MARNWEGLSPSYRARLERSGMTRQEYISGASLKAARGHANTPERPSDLQRAANRDKYQKYKAKRERLIGKIQGAKQQLFGGNPHWNSEHSRRNINRNSETGKQRGIKELQTLADIIEETDDDDLYEVVYDVAEYENAFWYH